MKKTLLFAATLLVAGGLAAQSIPDAGFETWNTAAWQYPQFYPSNTNGPNGSSYIDNVTQTTGYLGVNYGVMMQTINTLSGAQAGGMINGNFKKANITGGIPYNQKPTGIRFYYQYSPSGTDTAVVLVIFKKAGSMIDSFEIVISNTVTSYTLHSYFPKNPLPATPDTIVFGAISSIAGIRNGGGNVGSTFVIDSVTFTGVSSQPADMNGDFKNWVDDTVLYPSGWYDSYPGVYRTTDSYAGKYAVEMVTNDSINGLQAGQISTGYYPNNCNGNCHQLGGYSYLLQKDTLEFYYKYAPMGPGGLDTAQVNLIFVKDTAFYYDQMNLYAAPGYTLVKMPFNTGSITPDSVIVSFQSTWHSSCNSCNNNPYPSNVGSALKIDNLHFASQSISTGISKVPATGQIKVYPNPGNGIFTIEMKNEYGRMKNIEVFNVLGEQIYSQFTIYNSQFTINLSNQPAGMYLIEVTTDNGRFYQKVCKE